MAKSNVKPGTAGIWIGILLMVVSIGSCAGGVIWGTVGLLGQIDDVVNNSREQVQVGTTQTYKFGDDAAGLIVGVADNATDAASVTATLEGPDGAVTLDESTFSLTNSLGDKAYDVVGTFDAQQAGEYSLTVDGPEGASAVIAPVSPGVMAQRVGGGFLIGALLFLIGLILMIVTFSRRRKAKQAMATVGGPPPAMGGGFGAPPAPGGFGAPQTPPPPGGYGAPQAPQTPPPPGGYGAPQTPVPPAPGGYPPQQAPDQPQPYAPAPEAPPFTPPTQQMPSAPPAPPQAPGGYPPPPPPPAGS